MLFTYSESACRGTVILALGLLTLGTCSANLAWAAPRQPKKATSKQPAAPPADDESSDLPDDAMDEPAADETDSKRPGPHQKGDPPAQRILLVDEFSVDEISGSGDGDASGDAGELPLCTSRPGMVRRPPSSCC